MSCAESVKKDSNNRNTNSKATGVNSIANKFTKNFKNEYNYKSVKILIYTESLIDVEVEAITNSLDKSIDFRGVGLAALILKKYGEEIEEKSIKKASTMSKISPGMCFEVETNQSKPKYILNVISPFYSVNNNQTQFESDLFETFTNLIELTQQLNLKQIALPLLCTGVYKAPKSLCASILAAALTANIDTGKLTLEEIHLVNIDADATKCLIEGVELELAKRLNILEQMQSGNLIQQSENNLKKIHHKKESKGLEAKFFQKKSSATVINCQGCRQRIRNWIEIKACDHKICTTCLFDFISEKKCIVDGCSISKENPLKVNEQNLQYCEICQEDTLAEDFVKLKNCEHKVCKVCYQKLCDSYPKCPFCQKWFAKPIGSQPKGGQMTDITLDSNLPGFSKYKTIKITYYFPSGIQESNHPNPGKSYSSITRFAYLPKSDQGLKVLTLLRKAFEQGLTFTIGDSRTTGASGVITWNDIHHKTSQTGQYGYPDENYLNRVILDLKAKGIE